MTLANAEVLGRRGIELLRGNRAVEAVAVLREAAALAPDAPALWTNLGIALDRADATDQAIACLETSVQLSRRQSEAWLLLGVYRKKLGDLRGAEEAYRVVLEQEPASAIAWQCLALLLEEQRDVLGAIACFAECLAHGDRSPAVWANLGRLSYQAGRIEQANEAYTAALRGDPGNHHYRHMLRRSRFLLDVIDGLSVDDALKRWRQAAPDENVPDAADQRVEGGGAPEPPHWAELLETAELLSAFGHTDAAIRVAKKRREERPNSAAAEYLLQALEGGSRLDRAPPAYIVETFDAFAAKFDAQLVGVLGYDVPGKLCSAVREATAAAAVDDVLDAGCGTGLCGPLLRPIARRLVGLDLAPRMLDQAAKRGVYDRLEREDLVTFLGRSERAFDLIVAADVAIYFGDLRPFFTGASTAIRAGGLFAFSTESLPANSGGYRLKASGRFAHELDYVRGAAGTAFREERCTETTIRLDATERVGGALFLFRRR